MWNAIGRGAKAVIFWCWRDEVFGGESSGFGLTGADGKSEERLAALRATGDVLSRHAGLLDAYVPDGPRVGVFFEERNYHLDWAQYGGACAQAGDSMTGYLRALKRIQVPYNVVGSGHLDGLDDLELLVMPWPLVVGPLAAARIAAWVENGGSLLVESEVGAYDERGFYHYPDDRDLALRLGVRSLGRRVIGTPELPVHIGEEVFHLAAATWVEALDPGGAAVLATVAEETVATSAKRGAGKVIALGTFAGLAYSRERGPEFERFLRRVVTDAGATPDLAFSDQDGEDLQWRLGRSGPQRLLFVSSSEGKTEVTVRGPGTIFAAGDELVELISGATADVNEVAGVSTVKLAITGNGYAVWSWRPSTPS